MVIAWLNWVAPSTVPAPVQSAQATIMGNVLHVSDKAIGLYLAPLHTYKRGNLWMLEHACLKALAHRALNLDKAFGLVFESKVDQREARPLLYPGRFLMAEHIKALLTQL